MSLLISFLLSFLLESYSQCNAERQISIHQAAIGCIQSGLEGVHSLKGNPAGINAFKKHWAFTLNSEQQYFLSSINSTYLGVVKSINDESTLGVSISNFGLNHLYEQRLALTYARNINKSTHLGASFYMDNLHITEFGSRQGFNFSIGLTNMITENLQLGLTLKNPVSNHGLGESVQPFIYEVGLRYFLSELVSLYINMMKVESISSPQIALGLKYQLIDTLTIMTAFNSYERGASFGFSLDISEYLTLMSSVRYNQRLGVSPGLSLIYSWQKK